jgi:outer membrane protein assembly factor BamB
VKRRALLRTGSLVSLTALPGCAGLFGESAPSGRTETVNPALEGTPTPPGDVAWTVQLDSVEYLRPAGDNALVVTDRGDDGQIHHALDCQTGAEQWRVAFDTPRDVVPIGDVLLLTESGTDPRGDGKLRVFDPERGVELWNEGTFTQLRGFPAGLLLTGNPFQESPEQLVAFDRQTGERRWSIPEPAYYFWGAGQRVLGLVDRSTTVDTPTPTTANTPTPTTTDTSTPTTTDTATTTPRRDTGEYTLTSWGPADGTVRWQLPVPRLLRRSRAITPGGGRLVVADFGHAFLIDTETPRVVAEASLPSELLPYATVETDEGVFFGDWEFRGVDETPAMLGRLSLTDGETTIQTFPGTAVRPLGGEESVIAVHGTPNGIATVAHDPADGSERWRRRGAGIATPEAGPVVGRETAVVAYDTDGRERWRAPNPFGRPFQSTFGTEEGVVVRSRAGRLVAFHGAGVVSYDREAGDVRTEQTSFDDVSPDRRLLFDDVAVIASENRLYGIPV